MRVTRVFGFSHLYDGDLQVPAQARVFLDPADTEVGSWVGYDLIDPGCAVMDLGSGSGAAAAAFLRCGAGWVAGIDRSEDSVAFATARYCSPVNAERLTFVLGDFEAASSAELLGMAHYNGAIHVVASNPPYVPLLESDSELASIYGGPDGLKLVPAIVRHAAALRARLGLTIGSYSSPRQAARLLERAGYSIRSVTLAALRLGEFSRQHAERILELERRGDAFLWRHSGVTGYLVVGLSCVPTAAAGSPTADQVAGILSCACSATSYELESLSSAPFPDLPDLPVRIVVVPEPPNRQHW